MRFDVLHITKPFYSITGNTEIGYYIYTCIIFEISKGIMTCEISYLKIYTFEILDFSDDLR